jgi:hypothetical protein
VATNVGYLDNTDSPKPVAKVSELFVFQKIILKTNAYRSIMIKKRGYPIG